MGLNICLEGNLMGGTNKSVIGTFGKSVITAGAGTGAGGNTIIPPSSLRNQSNPPTRANYLPDLRKRTPTRSTTLMPNIQAGVH